MLEKSRNHSKYELIHPLSLVTKNESGIAPSFTLSGTHLFLGWIVIGGRTYSEADTQASTVCVFRLSADVSA